MGFQTKREEAERPEFAGRGRDHRSVRRKAARAILKSQKLNSIIGVGVASST